MAEERFRAGDGLQIVFEQWGDPAAPPVLLHHGFIADAHLNWVGPGFVDGLVGAGRRVIALDARGHGRSDKPHDPAFYGEGRMAADVRALLDHLGLHEPASVDLVGYSMGAIVSLLVAAGGEARLRRLAVGGVGRAVVTHGGVDTEKLPAHLLRDALLADDPQDPKVLAAPGVTRMRAFADFVGADRQALAAQVAAVHAKPIALDEISVPTLVFAGIEDPLAQEPEKLAAAIPGARLLTVPGDHLTALRAPDLLPAVIDFLA
mgnify:CR=1 FL=1